MQSIGALYWMFPGLVIALVTGWAVAVSYRSRRTSLVLLLWLALVLSAVLVGRLATSRPRDVERLKGFVGLTAGHADAHAGFEAPADAIAESAWQYSSTRRPEPWLSPKPG